MEIAEHYSGSFESNPVLHSLAAEIASRMTDLFQYDHEQSVMKHDELKSYAYVKRASDGLTLGFCFDDQYRPKRLHISGELPRYKDGRYYTISSYNKEADVTRSISVSLTKSAEKIARDIENRLVPGAKIRHEIAKAAIASEESYDDTHEALVKMAARITRDKLRSHDLERHARPEFYLRPEAKDYSDKVKVEGNRLVVTFEITSGDMADQLQKAVDFVNELKPIRKPEAVNA